MALRLTSPTFSPFPIYPPYRSKSSPTSSLFQFRQSKALTRTLNQTLAVLNRRRFTAARASLPQQQEQKVSIDEEKKGDEWGKVTAVLFDMDGVLCDSEEPSRMAGVDVFAEMGVSVTTEDFVSFMGTGEANFLGGVATVKGVTDFNPEKAKKRFFEIYLDKYAKPNSGIGFPGAFDLVMQCKNCGLKVAVASSADRIKVDANLAAAGLPISVFDVIVSADAFENLKPAPDIFLAASKKLNVHPSECLVIEDAFAGVQAAKAARMRCIAVTTTLSQEKMQQAGPSLIRKNIGDIKIDDVLNGGHPTAYNQAVERSYNNSLEHTSSDKMNENVSTERVQLINVRVQDINVNCEELTVLGGMADNGIPILDGFLEEEVEPEEEEHDEEEPEEEGGQEEIEEPMEIETPPFTPPPIGSPDEPISLEQLVSRAVPQRRNPPTVSQARTPNIIAGLWRHMYMHKWKMTQLEEEVYGIMKKQFLFDKELTRLRKSKIKASQKLHWLKIKYRYKMLRLEEKHKKLQNQVA